MRVELIDVTGLIALLNGGRRRAECFYDLKVGLAYRELRRIDRIGSRGFHDNGTATAKSRYQGERSDGDVTELHAFSLLPARLPEFTGAASRGHNMNRIKSISSPVNMSQHVKLLFNINLPS
jgi:hypothetical protein